MPPKKKKDDRKSYYIPFKVPKHVRKLLPEAKAGLASTELNDRDTLNKNRSASSPASDSTAGKKSAAGQKGRATASSKEKCIGCQGIKNFAIKTSRIHNVQKKQMKEGKKGQKTSPKKAKAPPKKKPQALFAKKPAAKRKKGLAGKTAPQSETGTMVKFRHEMARGVAEYNLRSKIKEKGKHLAVNITPDEDSAPGTVYAANVGGGTSLGMPPPMEVIIDDGAAGTCNTKNVTISQEPERGVTISYEPDPEEAEEAAAIEAMRRDVKSILRKLPSSKKKSGKRNNKGKTPKKGGKKKGKAKKGKGKKKTGRRRKTVHVSAYERKFPTTRRKIGPNTVFNRETNVTTRLTIRKRTKKSSKAPTALFASKKAPAKKKPAKGKRKAPAKGVQKAKKAKRSPAKKNLPKKQMPSLMSSSSKGYSVETSGHAVTKEYRKKGFTTDKSSLGTRKKTSKKEISPPKEIQEPRSAFAVDEMSPQELRKHKKINYLQAALRKGSNPFKKPQTGSKTLKRKGSSTNQFLKPAPGRSMPASKRPVNEPLKPAIITRGDLGPPIRKPQSSFSRTGGVSSTKGVGPRGFDNTTSSQTQGTGFTTRFYLKPTSSNSQRETWKVAVGGHRHHHGKHHKHHGKKKHYHHHKRHYKRDSDSAYRRRS